MYRLQAKSCDYSTNTHALHNNSENDNNSENENCYNALTPWTCPSMSKRSWVNLDYHKSHVVWQSVKKSQAELQMTGQAVTKNALLK